VGRCAVGVVASRGVLMGRMEYAEGRELHGLVRMVCARKSTKQIESSPQGRLSFPPFLWSFKEKGPPEA
jgi:hypothetical protein